MKKTKIAFKYATISAVAIALNILLQYVSTLLYNGTGYIAVSIIVGLLFTYPIKYILEKKHIFNFKANDITHDTILFIAYSAMAVVTTVIFIGFEYGFYWLFKTQSMRFLGATIGLTVGSFTKYLLDKQFVFKKTKETDL